MFQKYAQGFFLSIDYKIHFFKLKFPSDKFPNDQSRCVMSNQMFNLNIIGDEMDSFTRG